MSWKREDAIENPFRHTPTRTTDIEHRYNREGVNKENPAWYSSCGYESQEFIWTTTNQTTTQKNIRVIKRNKKEI